MRTITNKKTAEVVNILLTVFPQHGMDFGGVYDIADMLEAYWKEHGFDNHFYSLENGCLFIDGRCIGRFTSLTKKYKFDEKSYYTEGKILAKGESDYD